MVMVPSANGPVPSPENSKLGLLHYIVSLLGKQPLLQEASERLPLSNEGCWRMRAGASGHGVEDPLATQEVSWGKPCPTCIVECF